MTTRTNFTLHTTNISLCDGNGRWLISLNNDKWRQIKSTWACEFQIISGSVQSETNCYVTSNFDIMSSCCLLWTVAWLPLQMLEKMLTQSARWLIYHLNNDGRMAAIFENTLRLFLLTLTITVVNSLIIPHHKWLTCLISIINIIIILWT